MRFAKLCLAVVLIAPTWSFAALQLNEEEVAGKQIFLEGISPSGAEVHAQVGASGITLPASSTPCGSCHGADGRGRPEGGVIPPDITWRRLTAGYDQRLNGRSYPAYNLATLGRAVTAGIDPAGNPLDPAMPRFVMSPRDLQALLAYLKRLQDDHDPGVESDRLLLGSVLPATGALADLGKTVESMLRAALAQINEDGGVHGRRLELAVADSGTDQQSAEAAMQRLLQEDQVFAVVAPFTPALDGRLGQLLESSRTPVVGPLSPYGAGERSPLVFAALPGLREQLLALGRFARTDLDGASRQVLILHPQDDAYAKLAGELAEYLRGDGWRHVTQSSYVAPVQSPSGDSPEVVFFLGDNTAFSQLASALQQEGRQPYLLASSSQVAGAALTLPSAFSGRVYLAYPFTPEDWSEEGIAQLVQARQRAGLGNNYMAVQVGTLVTVQLLAEGLRRAGRDISRERLVKAIAGLQGFHTGLTPALEFGPGRSVGAAGAHIVGVDIAAGRFRPTGNFVRLPPD